MSDSTTVFRKVSLDRLSSPEQLDQVMRVTDARGWIALAALGLLLATAVMWGVVGRLPQKVMGTGILVKSGGVFEVVPTTGGRVIDVAVGVGDVVTEGQVVARIGQEALVERLQQERANLAAARADRDDVVAFGERDVRLQGSYLAQQDSSVRQGIAAAEQTLRWLDERIATQEQLVKQGLMTRNTVLATRQQYDATREKLADLQSQITQLAARRLTVENQRAEEARQAALAIERHEMNVAELERQLRSSSEVTAPETGRILEVMTERGSIVAPGEPILSLDLTGKAVSGLEAVVYVPSVLGKQIRPGMTIQIAPSTVKQEEFGFILGRVTYVSDFPATTRGMRRVLKNEKLVAALSGNDAPYEVRAELQLDPATTSGFRWSSSKGPPLTIQSGTLAFGNIEVAARRPIELVMPILRRQAGL